MTKQVTSTAQGLKPVSGLGHSKPFSSTSSQGQHASRRWLHSLGLLRPGTADSAITRTTLDRFGTSRRGIHEIARRVGSGDARRALLRNVGSRRTFCSENPRKKGEKFILWKSVCLSMITVVRSIEYCCVLGNCPNLVETLQSWKRLIFFLLEFRKVY